MACLCSILSSVCSNQKEQQLSTLVLDAEVDYEK